MNSIVLDSAAVLAFILKEPGGKRVDELLGRIDAGDQVRVAISSVNLCEVLTRLHRENESMTASELTTLLSGVELVPFDRIEAETAASYAALDRSVSLGDRACFALASSRKATAWTTDRAWARIKLNITIELLR